MLDERQRTRGYAFQTIFIGAGAVLASTAPWFLTRVVGLSNVAAPGEIPITVRYAFYLGAAMLLFTVLWTVLTSREYSPEAMAAFDDSPRQSSEERRVGKSVSVRVDIGGGGIITKTK